MPGGSTSRPTARSTKHVALGTGEAALQCSRWGVRIAFRSVTKAQSISPPLEPADEMAGTRFEHWLILRMSTKISWVPAAPPQ